MKKNYLIKLKNNDVIKIDEEQHAKLMKALSSKATTPAFIHIGDQSIRTDYIATIKAEEW